MPLRNSPDRKDGSAQQQARNIAFWQFHNAFLSSTKVELDLFKRSGLDSDSTTSSRTTSASSAIAYSEETCDCPSDEERLSNDTSGSTVPIVYLPTLYKDKDNLVVVNTTCKTCQDIEATLKSFAEVHVKAFEACKEKRHRFWQYIIDWNSKFQKKLESMKTHLMGEFLNHVDKSTSLKLKDNDDVTIHLDYYRLISTHLRAMEKRFHGRVEELKCPIRESFTVQGTDKTLRDLNLKINSCLNVLHQVEQKIRCMTKSWENIRTESNPRGYRYAIYTKADYMFNRLSSIFMCIDFLEEERKFYEEKADQGKAVLKQPKRIFLPPLQLKPKNPADQCPKPSNVKRRPQNSVKRKLPSSISHFYPFAKPQHMENIHASWYRTFLRPEDMRKEITQQQDTNKRVLKDIKQLAKEIQQLEMQLQLKEYVEQSVKASDENADEIIMFPDKILNQKATSRLNLKEVF